MMGWCVPLVTVSVTVTGEAKSVKGRRLTAEQTEAVSGPGWRKRLGARLWDG